MDPTASEEELRALLATLDPEQLAELERQVAKMSPADDLALSPGRRRHAEPAKRRACFDFSRVENAARQIKVLPKPGESIHCLMGGDYNGSDIIPALQSLAGAPIDDLYLATLGFNKTNAGQLCAMLDDGVLRRVSLICSHYFAKTDDATFAYAERELTARGQRIVATRNHAKLVLLRFGRARYVVESSANLRSCNNLEQFSLCRSESLYKFHAGWLEHAIAQGPRR